MKLSGTIIKYIFLTSVLFLFAGCVREDMPDCAGQGSEVMLQISVAASPATKAQTGNELTDLEKAIYSLRVYAFYGNSLAGHHHIYNGGQLLTQEELSFFMHVSMFLIGDQTLDFYVIANEYSMIDNGRGLNLTDKFTKEQLDELQFTTIDGIHPIAFPKGMPNIVKKSYVLDVAAESEETPPSGHENHQLVGKVYEYNENAADKRGAEVADNKLTFDLQRPVGKLNIYAAKAPGSSEDVNLTITEVRFLKNGTRRHNYVMPQSDAILKGMSSTLTDNVKFHLSKEGTDEPKVIDKILAEGNRNSTNPDHYTEVLLHDYYPHENPYGSSPERWSYMEYHEPYEYDADGSVTTWKKSDVQPGANVEDYKGCILEIDYYFGTDSGMKKTGVVYLPPIMRNNYYGIFCSMQSSGEIKISYKVLDWDDASSWEFVYDYPDYVDFYPTVVKTDAAGNVVKDEDGNPVYDYQNPTMYYTADLTTGAFKAYFNFWAPENEKFSPVIMVDNKNFNGDLSSATSENFGIRVKRRIGNAAAVDVTSDDGLYEAGNYQYEIQVYAQNNSVMEGVVVNLGITYQPNWEPNGKHELLMINGLDGEEGWAGGGNDPHWLEIEVKTPTN